MNHSELTTTQKLYKYYKGLADKTFEQLQDDDINWRPNDASNSIAIIVHHISGNMLSRFTDFLTSDGEKPWRDRDSEFEGGYASKSQMIDAWEKGWRVVDEAFASVGQNDLDRVVYIRNEGHTVFEAFQRQLAHYASHIGQIIYIAKELKGEAFKTLSIPKGGSSAFNQDKFSSEKTKKHFTDKP